MSYGADLADSYRRVAYYVDKILKVPSLLILPVEQPTKFEFVINLKTAKQIGLTIPPEVSASHRRSSEHVAYVRIGRFFRRRSSAAECTEQPGRDFAKVVAKWDDAL